MGIISDFVASTGVAPSDCRFHETDTDSNPVLHLTVQTAAVTFTRPVASKLGSGPYSLEDIAAVAAEYNAIVAVI